MSFAPQALSQRDPRWANETLGFDGTVTIGTNGATLLCLTMLVNGYGFHETPSSMNGKLKELGSGIGFLGSLIVWPGVSRAFPGISFSHIIVCRDQPAPLEAINTSLGSGQPLLVEIGQSPAPDLQNHWVLLYARQGEDYLMLDPWPQPPDTAPTTLTSRYGSSRPISEFITAVAWFAVHKNTPSPAPASHPLTVLVSSQASDGLRLRDRPSENGNTLEVLKPGTLLTVLEPAATAQAKIGVVNQWLNVRRPGGMTGFVAAWYVTK